ncbi:sugar transferase [Cytophagaceae bacterium ABcell3]|nr:sugar transferase [Cytophagaceae bacterium ABcell3]
MKKSTYTDSKVDVGQGSLRRSLPDHKIALIDNDQKRVENFLKKTSESFEVFVFDNGFKLYNWIQKGGVVNAVVSSGKFNSPNGMSLLQHLRNAPESAHLPFVFLVPDIDNERRLKLLKARVNEIFTYDFSGEDFKLRVSFLIKNALSDKKKRAALNGLQEYKMPFVKRAFDVVFASVALLFLSPFFFLLGVAIKLESRGPIFYAAKRAGTGYKIFDFYKFRSMRKDADALLKDMSHLNQYKKSNASAPVYEDGGKPAVIPNTVMENPVDSKFAKVSNYIQNQYNTMDAKGQSLPALCDECRERGVACRSVLMLDDKIVCEKLHLKEKKERAAGETFLKIKDDPRVTKIGKFIRNTSIDELPQLFNVLKGDMSIVGNRPLPLYEAEKITVDQFTLRFMAPAGITGLWQVTKRGTSEMSEEERMQLDNDYAKNYSFWRDIKIILKTIPALLQKENV